MKAKNLLLPLLFMVLYAGNVNAGSINNDPEFYHEGVYKVTSPMDKTQQAILPLMNDQRDYPYIDPWESYFELLYPQDIALSIFWSQETTITMIDGYVPGDWGWEYMVLIPGTHYQVNGDELIIYASFLTTLDLQHGSSLGLTAHFGSDWTSWFHINYVYAVSTFAYPGELDYDLTNPGNLFVNLVPFESDPVLVQVKEGANILVIDDDYEWDGRWFFVMDDYLSVNLTNVDDQITLTLVFDNGDETTLQITCIESGITNATLSPDSATYSEDFPVWQDITITWNDAESIENISVIINATWAFFEFDLHFYQLISNGDGTSNLRLFLGGDLKELMDRNAKPGVEVEYLTFRIEFDEGATANFLMKIEYQYYTISVTMVPENGGYVNINDFYFAGEEVQLFANSLPGYYMSEWQNASGDVISYGNPLSFIMPAEDVELFAVFNEGEPSYYTITYENINDWGFLYAISYNTFVENGTQLEQGRSIHFYADPWWGFGVKEWKVNGEVVLEGNNQTYFHYNLQENIHVQVEFIEYNYPSIDPDFTYFSLEAAEDLLFDIYWGSETAISSIVYFDDWGEVALPLLPGTDYLVEGNQLTITADFILSLNPAPYSWHSFLVQFNSWSVWIDVIVVGSFDPQLIPDQLTFDFSNTKDLLTSILHMHPVQVSSITNQGVALTAGQDYQVDGVWIFIKESYLAQQLTSVGQEISLDILLDTNHQLTLTIAAEQTGITNATITPDYLQYSAYVPDYEDITITWNDATAVTDLNLKFFYFEGFLDMDWPFYQVTDHGNGTANLRIFFDEGKMKSAWTKKEDEFSLQGFFTISFDNGAPALLLMKITFEFFYISVDIEPWNAGYVEGAYDYWPGDTVFLTAMPFDGFQFLHWLENDVIVSSDNPYVFTMPEASVFLTAVFKIEGSETQYSLTLLSNPAGAGILTGAGQYNQGTSVSVTATSNEGFGFESWKDAGGNTISTQSSFNFIMPSNNVALTANFLPVETKSTIAFIVRDGTAPIPGTTLNFNNQTKLTNEEGKAIFDDVTDGTHSFSASHDDYHTLESSITVAGEDITHEINLLPLSVSEIMAGIISIYPNPFRDHVIVSTDQNFQKIMISNITGQVVWESDQPENSMKIDTSQLPEGVYFISFQQKKGRHKVFKLLK